VTDIDQVRRFVLSLPGVSEEPHFEMSSFRVRGKIFATVPAGGGGLHVFMDELEAAACVAEAPSAYELLWWGRRVRGVRVRLAAASHRRVCELVEDSWRRKAPRRVIAEYDRPSAAG
jgi:hypothetical protein